MPVRVRPRAPEYCRVKARGSESVRPLTYLREKKMKLWEATVRDPGPGTEERKVRIGADTAEEARRKLQELYGPRSVPYLPRQIPQ